MCLGLQFGTSEQRYQNIFGAGIYRWSVLYHNLSTISIKIGEWTTGVRVELKCPVVDVFTVGCQNCWCTIRVSTWKIRFNHSKCSLFHSIDSFAIFSKIASVGRTIQQQCNVNVVIILENLIQKLCLGWTLRNAFRFVNVNLKEKFAVSSVEILTLNLESCTGLKHPQVAPLGCHSYPYVETINVATTNKVGSFTIFVETVSRFKFLLIRKYHVCTLFIRIIS